MLTILLFKYENENENIRKEINRPSKEINQQKNFIEDNKHLIIKIQNANNTNKLKEYYDKKENPYHKEYGKIPKYIENMKLENEKKLEMEKLRKKQQNNQRKQDYYLKKKDYSL